MNRTLKRAGAVVAAAALALSLGACSQQSGSAAGGDSDITIAMIAKGFSHQYWQAVKAGAEAAAAEEGVSVTFEAPPTESDVEGQVEMLTNALSRNPSAIGIAALDSRAVEPLLQQAQTQGIPVIAFDSGVDSDVPITTASTDNYAASALAAEKLSEELGGEGKVAMIIHDQTSLTGTQRRDGFVDWMTENAPGIELLTPQYANDQNLAADTAKAIFAANPDLDAIYGSNEGSAVGIVSAASEAGRDDVLIVGFDSGKAQTDAVKSGAIFGSVTQNPVGIGRETVLAALAQIRGETVEPVIDTGFFWYDASNIDDPEIAAVLYE
ncbi:ABC transporter substrate-binding protein [Pseudoclavibacter terrae]|uniref:ABC transporter substrate-binding protein n=1 Tax=Pseudoclavibacter terrae TaxID=1530195 RepID=UPI00232B09A4|nr:ABC transporter substrate-binding protein [Pseudoclavibacter terrae]